MCSWLPDEFPSEIISAALIYGSINISSNFLTGRLVHPLLDESISYFSDF